MLIGFNSSTLHNTSCEEDKSQEYRNDLSGLPVIALNCHNPEERKSCFHLRKKSKQALTIGTDYQQPCQRDAVVLFSTMVSGWHLLGLPLHPSDLHSHKTSSVKLWPSGT